jgi:RimJ/RimL family protein N-acetyltransferase
VADVELRFLGEMTVRPLYARTASDNVASLRVLRNAGFTIVGTEISFASARGAEIEESCLRLG